MEAASTPRPDLRLIDGTTGEVIDTDLSRRVHELEYENRDLEDRCEGYRKTVDKQAREIGALTRKLAEEDGIDNHSQGADIKWLIDLWREGSGHLKAKAGKQRIKMVKARVSDGFAIKAEPPETEPTLELAVIGLCAYPYRVFDKRFPTGRPSDRDDDLSAALKDEKHVESLSRLGWRARKEGWTPEGGWPEEEGK